MLQRLSRGIQLEGEVFVRFAATVLFALYFGALPDVCILLGGLRGHWRHWC